MARLTDLPSELIIAIFSFLSKNTVFLWEVNHLKEWSLFNKYLSPSILRVLLHSCSISLQGKDEVRDFLLAPRKQGQFINLVTKLELELVWTGFEDAMGPLSSRNAETFRAVPELRLQLFLAVDLDLPPQASMELAAIFLEWRFKGMSISGSNADWPTEGQRRVQLSPFPQVSEADFDCVILLEAFPSSLKSLGIYASTIPTVKDILINLLKLEKLIWHPHDIFPCSLPTNLRILNFDSEYLDPIDHIRIFQQLPTLVNLQHFSNTGLQFGVDPGRRTSLQWDGALSYLPPNLQLVVLGTHLDISQFRPTLNSIADYFAKNLPHLRELELAFTADQEEEKIQDMVVNHLVPQRLKVFATPLEVFVGC
jgi:hypothetical protein